MEGVNWRSGLKAAAGEGAFPSNIRYKWVDALMVWLWYGMVVDGLA